VRALGRVMTTARTTDNQPLSIDTVSAVRSVSYPHCYDTFTLLWTLGTWTNREPWTKFVHVVCPGWTMGMDKVVGQSVSDNVQDERTK
jgi:hypothetical protein